MLMYHESEIASVQERYGNWCQACLNFLSVLMDPTVVDRVIIETVRTHLIGENGRSLTRLICTASQYN